MDEMVDIIQAYCKNGLVEAELITIAAYIAGDEPTMPSFVKAKVVYRNSYYYGVNDIAKRMYGKLKPEHYPRLRRFYALMQHLDLFKTFFRESRIESAAKHFALAYDNIEEHVKSAILMFDSPKTLYRHEVETYDAVLEAMYAKNPQLLTAIAAGLDSVAEAFVIFFMLYKDYERYKYAESKLLAKTQQILNSVDNKNADKNEYSWWFDAFVMYLRPEGAVTAKLKEYYAQKPYPIIAGLLKGVISKVGSEHVYNSINNYIDVRELLDSIKADVAPLFEDHVRSNTAYPAVIKEQNEKLFAGRFADVVRATKIETTHPRPRGLLYVYLEANGQEVDAAKREHSLQAAIKEEGFQSTYSIVGSQLDRSDTAINYLRNLLLRFNSEDHATKGAANTHSIPSRIQYIITAYCLYNDFANIDYFLSKVDISTLLKALAWLPQYHSVSDKPYDKFMSYVASKHFDIYKAALLSLEENDHRVYLAMNLPKDVDTETLIELLGDKSKKISNIAFNILAGRKEAIDKIRPLVEAKKKSVREYVEKLLMLYEGGDTSETAVDVSAFYIKYGKNIETTIKWTNPENWPKVRSADGKAVNEQTLKYYVYQFLNSKTMDIPANTAAIAETLNHADLHALAADIYSQWTNGGAEAKKKGALLLMGVNANDGDVVALRKQIDTWADASRGAIAAEAVKAMALSGRDLALMQVDSMANKFKNKQVRKAATESFALAAAAMNLTSEQLADRIIPDLGFNQRGEKTIDYGTRSFTAILTPALTVELMDEAGKKVKALPKAGAKDNAAKAEAAKTEFSALKKSLKSVVSTQATRLEQALSTGRQWDAAAWEALFVKNPIMHSFAIGLVWGFYKDNKLANTFRYMDDGSLTDADENEIKFEDYKTHNIGLVHPLELDDATKTKWNTQMEDYEIIQPVLQLNRPLYLLTDAEQKSDKLERFGGVQLPGITLINKLAKMGWSKGSVQDAGCFYSTYKEFRTLKIGVQLNHSYIYVVLSDMDEGVTMGQVVFYKDEVARGSYVYDDPTKFIPLKDVPAKLFSEVVYELSEASKTSTSKDESWRNEVSQF